MKKLCIAAALTLGVVAANADVYEQAWDGTNVGIASSGLQMDYSGAGGQDTICFDDIVVGAGGWTITEVLGYGETSGPAGGFSGGGKVIFTSASGNAGTAVIASDVRAVSVLSSGNALFSGMNVALAQGTYRMGIYLKSNDSGNQWFWKSRNPQTGAGAIIHNPGGGLAGTTDPFPIADLGIGADLSFKVTYTAVPEPATFLALGAGLALLAARRRK